MWLERSGYEVFSGLGSFELKIDEDYRGLGPDALYERALDGDDLAALYYAGQFEEQAPFEAVSLLGQAFESGGRSAAISMISTALGDIATELGQTDVHDREEFVARAEEFLADSRLAGAPVPKDSLEASIRELSNTWLAYGVISGDPRSTYQANERSLDVERYTDAAIKLADGLALSSNSSLGIGADSAGSPSVTELSDHYNGSQVSAEDGGELLLAGQDIVEAGPAGGDGGRDEGDDQ